jgi:Tol biopolymer transport system component
VAGLAESDLNMKTKFNLLGAVLSLLVIFSLTHSAVAQDDRFVFYAPVVVTNVSHRTGVSYTTNTQIMTMNVDGSGARQLTTGTEKCGFPRWRPGKTHILFHRGTVLYVMDANGSGTFAVGTARGVGSDWSPDGRMVCYVGDPLSSPGPAGLWIVSVDPSAKGNKKVGTPMLVSEGDFYGPAWSPDGNEIAFSDQLTGLVPPGPHIRILELATGAKRTLDSMPGLLPSWSPGGNQIAFSGVIASGDWQLFIMNADFSGNTQVTDFDKPVLWPTWSGDGTQVAFRLGSGQGWDASLYKLALATGELTLLREKADHADWAP